MRVIQAKRSSFHYSEKIDRSLGRREAQPAPGTPHAGQYSVAGRDECGYKKRARLPSGLSVGTAQTEKGGHSHAETCFRSTCRCGPGPLTDV